MKTLAEHHWSAETILVGLVVIGLAIGSVAGLIIGSFIDNIGVGISLGALGGLIIGIIAGVMISDREE